MMFDRTFLIRILYEFWTPYLLGSVTPLCFSLLSAGAGTHGY